MEPSENKKIAYNLFANIASFLITICISLFVTPYIVNRLGSEAYGFVGLANNFVGYASLVTIALNSMAGRFVSVEMYRGDAKAASRYFSSVFFANAAIALVILPILGGIVWKLEVLIDIPTHLITDVKTAFAITFVQFIANLLLARYEIAAFIKNKLYLTQRNSVISNGIRLLTVVVCFSVFSTRVSYLTLGYFLGAMFVNVMNLYYTKKLTPELKTDRNYIDIKAIKELIRSGAWNLLNKLSAILLDGLDLLITNVFIGAAEMGALSISKTIPAMFQNLRGSLDYPFTPSMTRCYAEGDIAGVVKYARTGNKLLGIFMIAPMAVFAVFGQSFFRLWVPNENSYMIQVLSLLSIMSLLAGACINSVFTVFSITNKLRANSLVLITTGVLTVITNFLLLNLTDWGVYIIAGVSSFYSLLRNYIFTPLYGAHCLGVRKTTFYHEIVTGNLCLVINLAVSFGISRIAAADSWLILAILAVVSGILCVGVNTMIVLDHADRKAVIAWISKKLGNA
ncbi:MAG: hypothetical protein IJ302_03125 [Clostridia bacterium]|nr:hypothetical protein [Clostridia bacterium]